MTVSIQDHADKHAGAPLPGLDLEAGLERVGGDRPFYFKLLERFFNTQRGALDEVQADAAAQRWAQLEHRAHTLRGSAANVGAHEIEQLATNLEATLREGRVPAAGQVQQLVLAMRTVFDGIEAHFCAERRASDNAAPVPADAHAASAKLLAMLGQYSGDAPEYFDDVRSEMATILPFAALELMVTHLERYDFDAARDVLLAHLPQTE
jgi:HPt (histidine-containing phosphotransfer) domain-containing protein